MSRGQRHIAALPARSEQAVPVDASEEAMARGDVRAGHASPLARALCVPITPGMRIRENGRRVEERVVTLAEKL